MAEPIKCLKLLKGGFLLADRVVAAGDVVEVRGLFDKERSLLPVVPRIDQHRAQQLVERKLAVRDPGPARHAAADEAPARVERADLSARLSRTASRATAQPQREV